LLTDDRSRILLGLHLRYKEKKVLRSATVTADVSLQIAPDRIHPTDRQRLLNAPPRITLQIREEGARLQLVLHTVSNKRVISACYHAASGDKNLIPSSIPAR